jgi:pimeloyl-ACP methyl ester carboxylesterase
MSEINESSPSILAREDGATIAYRATAGKTPGVMFLTGYKSDMGGGKALFLEDLCRRRGTAFTRFDYQGHGLSSGAFTDGTIGLWTADAVAVLDAVTEGPQVLVGSSMGGWIMLLAALERPQRVAGLIGIAAAADFTEDLMPGRLTAEQKAALERDGVIYAPNPYGPEPTPIAKKFIDEGRDHLVLRQRLPLACPTRLIHGMRDADVPWQTSLRLCQMLNAEDVELFLDKDGEHRLSEPHDLDRLGFIVESLLTRIESPPPDMPADPS